MTDSGTVRKPTGSVWMNTNGLRTVLLTSVGTAECECVCECERELYVHV